jgi:hypothetical protein
LDNPEDNTKLEMIDPSKIGIDESPEHDLKNMANLIQFNGLVRKYGMDEIISHKCENLLDVIHKRNIHSKRN